LSFTLVAQAQETAAILGRVRLTDGTPPPDRIMVTLETRGLVVQNSFTDNQGQFSFSYLIANPYHVKVEVEGYQPVRETVVVNPAISPTFQVRIQLSPIVRTAAAEKNRPPNDLGGNPHLISAADYRRKYPPEAVKAFEKGVEAEQRRQPDEAIKHYKKAISIEPAFYPALNNLGSLYLRENKTKEAEEQFEKVIQLSPNDAQGYFNLGHVFCLTARYADAERTVEEGLKRQPDAAMGHFLMGYLYIRTGYLDEAEKRLRWALQLDALFSKARIEMANLYMQRQQPEKAIAELKLFIEKYPGDPMLPQVKKLLAKLESQKAEGK